MDIDGHCGPSDPASGQWWCQEPRFLPALMASCRFQLGVYKPMINRSHQLHFQGQEITWGPTKQLCRKLTAHGREKGWAVGICSDVGCIGHKLLSHCEQSHFSHPPAANGLYKSISSSYQPITTIPLNHNTQCDIYPSLGTPPGTMTPPPPWTHSPLFPRRNFC